MTLTIAHSCGSIRLAHGVPCVWYDSQLARERPTLNKSLLERFFMVGRIGNPSGLPFSLARSVNPVSPDRPFDRGLSGLKSKLETIMTNVISLSDLNTTINHEPRVQDILLAEKLGFSQVRDIRKLIDRNKAELESYGEVCATVAQIPNKGGRPSKTYYLGEGQALVICSLSRTPKAAEVRRGLIEVFMAWRRGQLTPAITNDDVRYALGEVRKAEQAIDDNDSHVAKVHVLNAISGLTAGLPATVERSGQRRLPLPAKPIDAKEIHALCDELFTVIGHFQVMNQQIPASRAKKKINKLLLDAAENVTYSIVKEVVHHA